MEQKCMNNIEALVKNLYKILGTNITIFNIEGDVLVSYPNIHKSFCAFINNSKNGNEQCMKCDRKAFNRVKKSGKIELYKCHLNLYEICVPLYTYGTLAGYLMTGQATDGSDYEKEIIKKLAEPFFTDKDSLEKSLNQIPKRSKEQLEAYASIIEVYANYFTLSNKIHKQKDNLAASVKEYIQKNCTKDISLEHLCLKFNCSKSTIVNSFKQEFNTSIHKYLTDLRINKSCDYLINSNLSIQQIAELTGFNDPNYFSKVFKKSLDITPKQYRKIYK